MNSQNRLDQLSQTLEAIRSGWPFLLVEVEARIATLTEQLVNNDSEQTRGRIKALIEIRNLPSSLQSERDGIGAALADEAAAN